MTLALVCKIINDWVKNHDPSLSSGLIGLILASNFDVPFFMLLLFNLVHGCHIIARVIVYYSSEDPFMGLSDEGSLAFYVTFVILLLVLALGCISVCIGYKVSLTTLDKQSLTSDVARKKNEKRILSSDKP